MGVIWYQWLNFTEMFSMNNMPNITKKKIISGSYTPFLVSTQYESKAFIKKN